MGNPREHRDRGQPVEEPPADEARHVVDEWAAAVTAFLLTDDDPTLLECLATRQKRLR